MIDFASKKKKKKKKKTKKKGAQFWHLPTKQSDPRLYFLYHQAQA